MTTLDDIFLLPLYLIIFGIVLYYSVKREIEEDRKRDEEIMRRIDETISTIRNSDKP